MSEKLQNWKNLQKVMAESHTENMIRAKEIGKAEGYPAVIYDGPSLNFNSEEMSVTSGWKDWPKTKGTLLDFIETKRSDGATEVFIEGKYFMAKKKSDIDKLKLDYQGVYLFITVWNNIEGFLF